MREILFRGKDTDGVWHEGFYCTFNEKIHRIYTGYAERDCGTNYPDFYTVVPETVGQYTGLTDKNGTKIFEGDIVVVYARSYHTICTVSWAETVAHFQLWQINTIPKTSTNLNLGNYDCEVIGNIHDNPEILKEREENE